jgi:hypothetical protein
MIEAGLHVDQGASTGGEDWSDRLSVMREADPGG